MVKKVTIWAMLITTLTIAIYLLDKDVFNMYISIHSYTPLNSIMNLPFYVYIVFIVFLATIFSILFVEGNLSKKDLIVIPILSILFIESIIIGMLGASILEEAYYRLF